MGLFWNTNKQKSPRRFPHELISLATINDSALMFRDIAGADAGDRVDDFVRWCDQRVSHNLWPYNRTTDAAPGPSTTAFEESGRKVQGLNLASQDYLSLATHRNVVAAATEAAREYGVHSSGSAALMGNTRYSRQLERRVGEVLGYEHVLLYPTGWGAGYGLLRGLVRPSDHVVLDGLAHNCLQDGAQIATKFIHIAAHNHIRHVERTLKRIRADDTRNAVFVVSEGLFSMDSDTPDIPALQQLCRSYNALLILDIAHDFGVLGPTGRSSLEEAGMLGQADIVLGSFSKTFASNGGFVCVRDGRLLRYLRFCSTPWIFSNALSPIQAACVEAAMKVAFSGEGDKRRRSLFQNVEALRSKLTAGGLDCMGRPSPVVPVIIGSEMEARIANYLAAEGGVLTNVAEFPGVPRGKARFRLQVQAGHSVAQMHDAAAEIVNAAKISRQYSASLTNVQATKLSGVPNELA